MNETQKKPHLVCKTEVLDYHHYNGQDPAKPRPSTKVKAMLMLPDGFKSYVEFFLDGHHHFSTPLWNFGFRLGADYKNKLAVVPVAWSVAKD